MNARLSFFAPVMIYVYLQVTINGKNIYVERTYARLWILKNEYGLNALNISIF